MSKRKSQRKRAAKAAKALPAHMQDVAFTKFSHARDKRRRERGTFGAASPVRRIDPETGKIIPPDEGAP